MAGKPGANWTQVTPEHRKRVAPLVRHYMKQTHPFGACVRDNTKRFGEDRAKRICAVVKDMGSHGTGWRNQEAEDVEVLRFTNRLLDAADGDAEGVEEYMLRALLADELVDVLPEDRGRTDSLGRPAAWGGRPRVEATLGEGVFVAEDVMDSRGNRHSARDGKFVDKHGGGLSPAPRYPGKGSGQDAADLWERHRVEGMGMTSAVTKPIKNEGEAHTLAAWLNANRKGSYSVKKGVNGHRIHVAK